MRFPSATTRMWQRRLFEQSDRAAAQLWPAKEQTCSVRPGADRKLSMDSDQVQGCACPAG